MVLDKLNPICPLAMSSVTFDLVQVSSLDSKRTVNIEKTTPYFRVKTKAGYSPELSSPTRATDAMESNKKSHCIEKPEKINCWI